MRELDQTKLMTNKKLVKITALTQWHGFLFINLLESLETQWGQHSKSKLPWEIARTNNDSLPDLKDQSNTHGSNLLDILQSMDDGHIP